MDIAEDSIRVYNNAESMSSIIGYTGSASQEELDELSEIRDDYENTSVIGKTGNRAVYGDDSEGNRRA